MSTRGRPRLSFQGLAHGRRIRRCELIDRALSLPQVAAVFPVSKLFPLISSMSLHEVRQGLDVPRDDLLALLECIDGEAGPSSGASLRDIYYHWWNPKEGFKRQVAHRLGQELAARDRDYVPAIHAAAERVSADGIFPGRSNPIHLPPWNIIKHFYQHS